MEENEMSTEQPAVFTQRLDRGTGWLTREEIMAIPDRKIRRAALAENINYLKGDFYYGE